MSQRLSLNKGGKVMVLGSTFVEGSALEKIGHVEETNRIIELVEKDCDVLLTGVPGSGRYALIQRSAEGARAALVGIDCIRATNCRKLVDLFLESTLSAFSDSPDAYKVLSSRLLSALDNGKPFRSHQDSASSRVSLVDKADDSLCLSALQTILNIIGQVAIAQKIRIIVVFKQISHIRSWDRKLEWEELLRLEIYKHPQVSYVILETVAELEEMKKKENISRLYEFTPVEVVKLAPLPDAIVTSWLRKSLIDANLVLSPDGSALKSFLHVVAGHISTAEALLRHSIMMHGSETSVVDNQSINKGVEVLLSDLSAAFESFLLMLPASQLQLIECLAIEPTPKPQSKEYIQKYNLSKGGTLQGALEGLQKKGLIYGHENSFRLTLPLFAVWIQNALR
jgi:hypothetical protein